MPSRKKVWSELAQECIARGIEFEQSDDAKVLVAKLKAKPKSKEE